MQALNPGSRIVHSMYGRGRLCLIDATNQHAFVQIDDEPGRRRVRLRDLLPEPDRMPPNSAPPLPPIRSPYRLLVVR